MGEHRIRHCTWVVALGVGVLASTDAAAAGRPMNPFGKRARSRHRYTGTFHMSDGTVIEGPARLKGRRVFKIFDRVKGRHREFPLSQVSQVECKVIKEWEEKIWRWETGGEHKKIDTGQSYPVRKFEFKLTLKADEEEGDEAEVVEGGLSGVIFVQVDPRDLRNRDVHDWRGLCTALKTAGAQQEPSAAKRVWELMPEDARKLVVMAASQDQPLRETRYGILDALNEALKRPDFYRAQDFAGVALPDKATELLGRKAEPLTPRQVQALNRVVISAAFPRVLAAPRKREEKLWYHDTFGDKTMIGKTLSDIVYIKRMAFTKIEDTK